MRVTNDIPQVFNPPNDTNYAVSAKLNAEGNGIDTSTSVVTGGGDESGTAAFRTADKELGKDDFLLLLVTQLRYQDPLNPMDNTQFVSQLAQFRALEGTSNVQKAVEKLDGSFQGSIEAQQRSADSMASTAAISLIGKTARMQVENLKWYATPGEKIDIPVYIGDHKQATVEIVDGKGVVIKTIGAAGKDDQNTVKLAWDGSTDAGGIAPAGTYTVHIAGEETDGSLYAFVEDVVTGVRFTDDNAMIKIHGLELPLGNILDVAQGIAKGQGQAVSSDSAVALLGKTVRIRQDGIVLGQTDKESIGVKVNAAANSVVELDICNAKGDVVQTLSATADAKGVAFFAWNGSAKSGGYAEPGNYSLRIKGAASDPSLYAFIEGTVEGVSNVPGGARIRINGVSYGVSDIVDISNGPGKVATSLSGGTRV